MANPIMDDIAATTLKEIFPKAVEDNYFLATPLEAYLKDHATVPWEGGAYNQNTFLTRGTIGGPFAKGDNFNTQQVNLLDEMIFTIKLYEENVTVDLVDGEVFNRGPRAVIDLTDVQMKAAVLTQSARLALDLSLHGQANASGIVGNRPTHINGWIEALNDGITPGWDGSIFTAYGTRVRTTDGIINSVPYFAGNADGTTAPVSYTVVEETYQDCCIDGEHPDLGVMNKALYAYMKEKMQPQQRFAQEKDPIWGVDGLRFNSAMLLVDHYFPSLKYGKNDSNIGNWLTGTFTSPGTVGTGSNMPTSTTINVGEVLSWFNTNKMLLRISNSELFNGGFRGFVAANNNTRLSGQIMWAGNLMVLNPRMHKSVFGFGS